MFNLDSFYRELNVFNQELFKRCPKSSIKMAGGISSTQLLVYSLYNPHAPVYRIDVHSGQGFVLKSGEASVSIHSWRNALAPICQVINSRIQ
mgnify:CR=1 FL=1